MIRNPDLDQLERDFGVILPGVMDFTTPAMARDVRIAMDAQAVPVTVANAGIPSWLSTWIDPEVIRVAVAPMRATEILGQEVKKGDWTTDTAMFPVVEATGETSSYGDWNNNGSTGANFSYVFRQAYYYQTITQWGEREVERVGLAKINYKNELDRASALVLNKFQNKSYFFGIAGMANYGLLNDPSLPAAITPITKAATGTSWAQATPTEILSDVQKLWAQLMTQTGGLINTSSRVTLALPPVSEGYLLNTNSFGVRAIDVLTKNYPNMRIISAPEYATTGGNVAQMIADDIDGQDTGYTAFTEKLRAHPVVQDLSAWKQKKSQGTWGAIIKQPLAYAQMIGI
jgi:hypothetical protein